LLTRINLIGESESALFVTNECVRVGVVPNRKEKFSCLAVVIDAHLLNLPGSEIPSDCAIAKSSSSVGGRGPIIPPLCATLVACCCGERCQGRNKNGEDSSELHREDCSEVDRMRSLVVVCGGSCVVPCMKVRWVPFILRRSYFEVLVSVPVSISGII
jgi:hypothetical protein